jgi:hypothetical protein
MADLITHQPPLPQAPLVTRQPQQPEQGETEGTLPPDLRADLPEGEWPLEAAEPEEYPGRLASTSDESQQWQIDATERGTGTAED